MQTFDRLSFDDGARVVFIGSSTVASGHFIAKLFDYYSLHFPEKKVKFYNFGVPGETAKHFMKMKRNELLLELQPTEVVLMFGMNDIGRGYYSDANRDDPECKKKAEECKRTHVEYTKQIGEFMKEHNQPITLCSSQSYDEVSDIPAENLVGCHGAVLDIFRADIEALKPYGLKGVINLCEPMYDLLWQLKERGLPSFIGADRVHPTKVGHDVMARIILRELGFLENYPTVDDIADGSVELPPLSEVNQKRKTSEELWRSLTFFDFMLSWGQENMTDEEKCNYWIEQRKTMSEADGYRYTVAKYYPERKLHEKEYFADTMRYTDEMYD